MTNQSYLQWDKRVLANVLPDIGAAYSVPTVYTDYDWDYVSAADKIRRIHIALAIERISVSEENIFILDRTTTYIKVQTTP